MSKNKKKTGTSAGKESFSNILGESKRNALACTVETQHVRKVDLNWTCLFCLNGNEMVRLRTGSIYGSLFRTIRILNLFWTGLLGLFLHPCVSATSLLPAFWNGPERKSKKSHS